MLSRRLNPGDRLRHRSGTVVELACRKQPDDGRSTLPFLPGWWLTDGGGLADFVIDAEDSEWRQSDGEA